MKIRFTSVSSQEVAELLRNVAVRLEDEFIPKFAGELFGSGVDQFTAIVVAVSSDKKENEKFCAQHNSVGKYKDMFTKEWVRFISVALPFDPIHILSLQGDSLRTEILDALQDRLANINLQLPKQFDYAKFSAQFFKL